MNLEEALARLELSPKAFTFWGRYRDMCVYISGFDDATGHELLKGFQVWLGSLHPELRGLAYPSLIARSVLLSEFTTFDALRSDQDERLRTELLGLLRTYLDQLPQPLEPSLDRL